MVIVIVGFGVDRAFKYSRPDAYDVFAKNIWTIEGIFIAVALIAGLYQYFIGSFH